MHPFVEERRDELLSLCRKHGVRRLDLFGSAASGEFDPSSSDLDFVVELEDLAPPAYADAYLGLLEDLTSLFGRPVDLVVDSAVRNPYFRESLERTRTPLYAARGERMRDARRARGALDPRRQTR